MNRISTLALAAILALATVEALGQSSGRVRVDPKYEAKDPFALRAGGGAERTVAPKPRVDFKTSAPESSGKPIDAILLRGETEPLACEILSISGKDGATAKVAGKTRAYRLADVKRVELSTPSEINLGIEAFESGKKSGAESEFARALALFQQGRDKASRRIEKELSTVRIVDALVALGRDDEAVSEFFLLCRLDPYSPYLSSIPLRWVEQAPTRNTTGSGSGLDEREGEKWLGDVANPTGRLLAASVFLRSSTLGIRAVSALRDLATLEAPEGVSEETTESCRVLSLLASAQLWRNDIFRAPTEQESKRRTRTIELLPPGTRSGPLALLAEGERKAGDTEKAGLDFLRVALENPDRFSLAAFASNRAAEVYEQLGDKETANKIREDSARRRGARAPVALGEAPIFNNKNDSESGDKVK